MFSLAPLARFEDPPFPGAHSPRGAPVDVRLERTFETGDELAMTVALTRTLRTGRDFSGDTVTQRQHRVRMACRLVVLGVDGERAPNQAEVIVERARVENDATSSFVEKVGDTDFAMIPEVDNGTRVTLSLAGQRVGVQRINGQTPHPAIAAVFVSLFSGATLEALSGSLFGDVRARRVGENWVVSTNAVRIGEAARRIVTYNARLDWRGAFNGEDSVRFRGWAVSPEFTTAGDGEEFVRNRVVIERTLVAPVDGRRLPFSLSERRTTDAVGYAFETMTYRNGARATERVPRAESLIDLIEVRYERYTPARPSRPTPNRVEGGDADGVATKRS